MLIVHLLVKRVLSMSNTAVHLNSEILQGKTEQNFAYVPLSEIELNVQDIAAK
jgi:hypothetical protein